MRELLQHPTAFCSSPLMSPDGFVLLTASSASSSPWRSRPASQDEPEVEREVGYGYEAFLFLR